MARNVIVVNVDLRETRIALIESGVVAELHIERQAHQGTVGNIVLGKVTRVLPGMQAAFIDVGHERAAFLHVEDLIRPDDFDAYLSSENDEDASASNVDAPREEEGDDASDTSQARSGNGKRRRRERSRGGRSARGRKDEAREPQKGSSNSATPTEEGKPEGSTRRRRRGRRSGADREPGGGNGVEATADDELELATSSASGEEQAAEADGQDGADGDERDRARAPSHSEDDQDAGVDDSDRDDGESNGIDDEGSSSFDDSDDDDSSDDEDDDSSDEDDTDSDDSSDDEDDDSSDEDDTDSDSDSDSDSDDSSDEDNDDSSDEDDTDSDDSSDDEDDDSSDEDDTDSSSGGSVDESASNAGEASDAEASASNRSKGRGRSRADRPADDSQERRSGSRSRRRRRKRRRGSDAEAQPVGSTAQRSARRDGSRRSGGQNPQRADDNKRRRTNSTKDNGAKRVPARVSRSVPISEVVKEGDQVVVQISKEPIGTKGARVTSHVSLPGRYVVYLPTVDHVGISKRIGSSRERGRLRTVIESMKPNSGGLIVRTVAEGLTKKQLKADVGYLIKVWNDVATRRENAKAPQVLYDELDLVLKVARDFFTDDVDLLVIDDRDQYARLVRFVEMFMPSRVKDIKLYTGDEPVFDAYGIEDEIRRALSRKVPLPSGGSLIVDQAEALTAIDVNTGRFVGKGSKDLEETALKTNLEAVEEIAYQLRFRNIGGLVILDLIDMERAQNRDKVWRALEQQLARDKAKTTINRISELGLIEMTRKRTRESLGRTVHEACFYCDGTGHIQSRETIAHEILRQVRRDRLMLPGYSIHIQAHPAVIDFLKFEAKDALHEAERRYMRRLELHARAEFHIEQYDLQGR